MDERRLDEETALLAAIELSILGTGAEGAIWCGSDGILWEAKQERSCGFNNGYCESASTGTNNYSQRTNDILCRGRRYTNIFSGDRKYVVDRSKFTVGYYQYKWNLHGNSFLIRMLFCIFTDNYYSKSFTNNYNVREYSGRFLLTLWVI